MVRIGRRGFLAVAVVFHLIYIYSIFDIYFVSPIVHGMQQYRVDAPAPAQRLFLVVGDGLRADKCFQAHDDPDEPGKTRHLAPFVRDRILNEGTFGVSHTRVPTESRPGHVALIAGLYEDVSAVTTGWKLNPVNFDSVFNQSRHTWSWGSPDILPMFKEGASDKSRVDADMYDEEMEDFTSDAMQLDIWVFDRVKQLFEDAKTNSTLNEMLHQDKLVFFLHLLGLDTTGHSYRPYSPEYLRNIKIVDKGLSEINKLVNEFYQDDKTAWVFTADHGMSDWGSHGDGHPDNTRTPLVAWGAGVKKPVKTARLPEGSKTGHEDGFSSDWNLDTVRRVDTAQADVAALMAYLIGVNFPSNSVGELPLEYLDADPPTLAAAAKTNARQILEMYRVKEAEKKKTQLNYKPYAPLTDIEAEFAKIDSLIEMEAHQTAIAVSMELIKTGLQGLRYLQTYDWLFLRTLITLGYLGWIAFALTTVVDTYVLHNTAKAERTVFSSVFFLGVLASLYGIFIVQKSRPTYYFYAFFPVYFWEEVYVRRNSTISAVSSLYGSNPDSKKDSTASRTLAVVLNIAACIALLEAIVTGYFHREVFTGVYLLATTWPFFYGSNFVRQNRIPIAGWVVSCLLMSTFTLLSAMKTESPELITAGGVSMFLLGLLYLTFGQRLHPLSLRTRTLLGLQTGLIALTLIITLSSVASLRAKTGLPLGNQVAGWLTLGLSLTIPLLHRPAQTTTQSLFQLFLTFSPSFLLLSISYEALFHIAFSALLVFWIILEKALPRPSPLSPRTAMFFFFLLQSAFFSTGNIASISSFSLDSVYRLIPIFDPFAMGALLLYKLMIPFAMISAALAGLGVGSVFMLATAVSDVLTLNFFWLVKDEGSWLEIGSTISHFCIGGALGVFVGVLELIVGVMGGGAVKREVVGEVKEVVGKGEGRGRGRNGKKE